MDSSNSSVQSSPNLSPTTSLVDSLTSLKTEEHNELYDHRQHPDFTLNNNHHDQASLDLKNTRSPNNNNDDDSHSSTPPSQRRMALDDADPVIQAAAAATITENTPSTPANSAAPILQHHRSTQDVNVKYNNTNSTNNNASLPLPRRLSKAQSLHSRTARQRANSTVSSSAVSNMKTLSDKSSEINLDNTNMNGQRRRTSFDSDSSQASRESQETEEDVCFPMEPQYHTRINGIDFDELEEFVQQSLEKNSHLINKYYYNNVNNDAIATSISSGSNSNSSAAKLKYTPRLSHDTTTSTSSQPNLGVSFANNKVEGEDASVPANFGDQSNGFASIPIPDRFSFFSSDSDETVHATDIPSLVSDGTSFYDLFRGGEPTWWLDCSCPTDDEMRCIAKAFGIHPLTAEDIRMQETREKVELFKSYYFVCFHTFENDKESEEFLEPINVYLVVFSTGILTFHFGPISHSANVRRRVRQLRDYVNVNSDWLCYALIDDITDSFAPVIQSIEYEADAIEDSVFLARDIDLSLMLQKIGEGRRKTMTLMRLLSGKADVIKMFAKRCQDEANGIGPALTSQINIANLQATLNNTNNNSSNLTNNSYYVPPNRAQPRADIAMYLGDIQDHLLTMFQNLSAYEKIFARSHSNYLAQLQLESFNANHRVTEMLGKVTIIGTMLVPLNVITGLFGMNVTVPGQDKGNLAWWFGILGVLLFLAFVGWLAATWWISSTENPTTLNEAAESGAKSIITKVLPRRRAGDNSSNNNRPRSIASLATKYTRYD
ncbi:hypothetical protein KAFR_0C01740 [Kazachstania africana CBS 2517]|uniref:Uncharacterized protein n=1 Tax=Kazachstania africana (strain ATCC 22294 / BCRC 22015 / CBS 2517 / CECT 1963 / NBRC 1671 / NRRL Y-8276) TaxID=1071382 RepID=H2AS17_KAZAF|nr:hypothetical protein KAFR_0C01740 [Kazachstania africana CBS 2517]CCF57167.1 hypothetical protein KAFR_0C01740 [Kazachstania africana CBS 2517]